MSIGIIQCHVLFLKFSILISKRSCINCNVMILLKPITLRMTSSLFIILVSPRVGLVVLTWVLFCYKILCLDPLNVSHTNFSDLVF